MLENKIISKGSIFPYIIYIVTCIARQQTDKHPTTRTQQ
jgi:hypothetical protein